MSTLNLAEFLDETEATKYNGIIIIFIIILILI